MSKAQLTFASYTYRGRTSLGVWCVVVSLHDLAERVYSPSAFQCGHAAGCAGIMLKGNVWAAKRGMFGRVCPTCFVSGKAKAARIHVTLV